MEKPKEGGRKGINTVNERKRGIARQMIRGRRKR